MIFRVFTVDEVRRAGFRPDGWDMPWGQVVEGEYVLPWKMYARIHFKRNGATVTDSIHADVLEPLPG